MGRSCPGGRFSIASGMHILLLICVVGIKQPVLASQIEHMPLQQLRRDLPCLLPSVSAYQQSGRQGLSRVLGQTPRRTSRRIRPGLSAISQLPHDARGRGTGRGAHAVLPGSLRECARPPPGSPNVAPGGRAAEHPYATGHRPRSRTWLLRSLPQPLSASVPSPRASTLREIVFTTKLLPLSREVRLES